MHHINVCQYRLFRQYLVIADYSISLYAQRATLKEECWLQWCMKLVRVMLLNDYIFYPTFLRKNENLSV
jgi:hypothetical protein